MFQKKTLALRLRMHCVRVLKKRFFNHKREIGDCLVNSVYVIDKNITYHFDLFSCGIFSELMNPFENGNKQFFGEIQVQICSLAEKNYEKNSSVGFLN